MLRILCKHSEANELLPILSFIDSLQEEPKETWPPQDSTPTYASTEYKVNKELSTNPNMESSDAKCGKLTNPYSKYARVFRQLYDAGLPCGSRPTKIAQSWTDSDGKEYARSNGISALTGEPETLYEKMDSVAEEKSEIPTELEEEVNRYWNDHALEYRLGRVADIDFLHLTARHFAKWQKKQDELEFCYEEAFDNGVKYTKEQMMKEAVEGSVIISYIDRDGVSYCNIVSTDIPAEKYGIEEGSKCKFLILKDDETSKD